MLIPFSFVTQFFFSCRYSSVLGVLPTLVYCVAVVFLFPITSIKNKLQCESPNAGDYSFLYLERLYNPMV